MEFFESVYDCLMECDVHRKLDKTSSLYKHYKSADIDCEFNENVQDVLSAGRPESPELVRPAKLKQRSLYTKAGLQALVHAVAHIEFNAINLALDAAYRFRGMPEQYYKDWLKVASEEAYHFSLLRDRLNDLELSYGDLPAHNGLWEMTVKTRHDVMVRMALVPRVLEARGLDVTPGMMKRLQDVGDTATVDVLEIILRDEIGHVKIGSNWFHYCCEQRDLEPMNTFQDLLNEYMSGSLRGPFNREGRLQSGFSENELNQMEQKWKEEIKG